MLGALKGPGRPGGLGRLAGLEGSSPLVGREGEVPGVGEVGGLGEGGGATGGEGEQGEGGSQEAGDQAGGTGGGGHGWALLGGSVVSRGRRALPGDVNTLRKKLVCLALALPSKFGFFSLARLQVGPKPTTMLVANPR